MSQAKIVSPMVSFKGAAKKRHWRHKMIEHLFPYNLTKRTTEESFEQQ